MKRLLLAEWIAPMDRPPIRGGVVFDEQTIIAVDVASRLKAAHPDATIDDAGAAVILPGLVNAHTHLELSNCACGKPPSDGFVGWLMRMIAQAARDPARLADATTRAVEIGTRQCLRFGVTSVGDISRQCHLTRPLLRDSALRVVSYGEILAMAQRRDLLEQRLSVAMNTTFASPRLRIGLTPHAPYSIESTGYQRCLQMAQAHNLPLATHLAETPDEAEFLASHTGPFRELWKLIDGWDDRVPQFQGGPIRFAQSLGLLDYPALLAHVNYCDDEEMAILARGRASVVYCPRTHAYFGHPPHRWQTMLARGINVAVGTDSCASSPDLNLVDDLRLLHRIAPDVPAETLWEMATLRAARAINQQDRVGTITPGKMPDLAVFPAAGADPLREILERETTPSQVWIGGQRQSLE